MRGSASMILRGVALLGIDSGYTPMPVRREVWQRLASDMKPNHLREMVRTIPFEEISGTFDKPIKGQMRGRFVVDMAA